MSEFITNPCEICPLNVWEGEGHCPIKNSIEHSQTSDLHLQGLDPIGEIEHIEFSGDVSVSELDIPELEIKIIDIIKNQDYFDIDSYYIVSYRRYKTPDNACDPGHSGEVVVYDFIEEA